MNDDRFRPEQWKQVDTYVTFTNHKLQAADEGDWEKYWDLVVYDPGAPLFAKIEARWKLAKIRKQPWWRGILG